ncbi:MAG: phosphoribosylamine--glycine ligase, partial [Gammaproteobacteria bacterium]|nr:phosphoribosylamine--glycine ligase [Gammaproteobacteria bacterium]
MKVLIIGGGGREHALAWKVAQSTAVSEVLVAPGNAGTAREPNVRNLRVSADDITRLVKVASEAGVELTIVGPEAPLVSGLVDAFSAAGLRCFGPSRLAAQLEGSKSFSKDFLARHGIPTAEYRTFTDLEPACRYIERQGAPIVVKADGLAAGKGVTVADKPEVAVRAVRECLAANKFGEAGRRVVIEECLAGEEASFICVVDGETALPLASSQDHKARDDGDCGPNTGGMGAYSPAPIVTDALHRRIMREVIGPTVAGLAGDGHPYVGFLYAGLMIDPRGNPKVLEYNCRFGDPETQPIMMRLQSDLVVLCNAALDGVLHSTNVEWDGRAALGVVMAAGGYPETYRKGDVIKGLDGLDSPRGKV